MASSMCNSFKAELLTGNVHLASHTYKIALYSEVLPATTTTYSSTNEVAHASYTAGGKNLGTATVSNQSGTACWDFNGTGTSDVSSGAITWTAATISAKSALIYNASSGNKAVAVLDFNGTVTASGGTFAVTLPGSGATTSIVRIA